MIGATSALRPRQAMFWLGVAAVVVLLLWLLHSMLTPFVLGMALAYVCDPLADRLEAIRVPRWLATLTVLGVAIGVGVVLMLLVLPLIARQIGQFVQQAPELFHRLRYDIVPQINHLIDQVAGTHADEMRNAATSYAEKASSVAIGLLGNLWTGGLAVFDVLYIMLLTPLVTFYFLRDWDRMIATIDSWMPRRQSGMLRALAREIDDILAAFVRGQATVCVIFAVYYSVALSVAGLDFAIIIGIAAGVLTFIPYLGAIAGLIASVTIAFIQFDDYIRVVAVAAVYLFGHAIESNIVTPMLVGDRVKLHPVWIIFALLAGGTVFGFTGVLLAVPVAAVIGVMVRFAIRQYLASDFYDNRVAPLPVIDRSEL